MDKYIFMYFCIISFLSLLITVIDKNRAIRGKRRIREKTLIIFGFFGGAAVMYITMLFIRHKTRHLKFMLLLPVFVILHIAVLYALLK